MVSTFIGTGINIIFIHMGIFTKESGVKCSFDEMDWSTVNRRRSTDHRAGRGFRGIRWG